MTYLTWTWRLCFYLCSGSRIFSCPDPPSAIPEVDAERPRMDSHLAGKLFIFDCGQGFEWDNFTLAEGANTQHSADFCNLMDTCHWKYQMLMPTMEWCNVSILPATLLVMFLFSYFIWVSLQETEAIDNYPLVLLYGYVWLGRYQKFSRRLCQTPWLIEGEKHMDTSIQELISQHLEPFFKTESLFKC